jgi:hypothetical protein
MLRVSSEAGEFIVYKLYNASSPSDKDVVLQKTGDGPGVQSIVLFNGGYYAKLTTLDPRWRGFDPTLESLLRELPSFSDSQLALMAVMLARVLKGADPRPIYLLADSSAGDVLQAVGALLNSRGGFKAMRGFFDSYIRRFAEECEQRLGWRSDSEERVAAVTILVESGWHGIGEWRS